MTPVPFEEASHLVYYGHGLKADEAVFGAVHEIMSDSMLDQHVSEADENDLTNPNGLVIAIAWFPCGTQARLCHDSILAGKTMQTMQERAKAMKGYIVSVSLRVSD